MLQQIISDINAKLQSFPVEDKLLFRNKEIPLNGSFSKIITTNKGKVAFIDGGQAEVLSSGNFCLSFIRIAAQIWDESTCLEYHHNLKTNDLSKNTTNTIAKKTIKHEFYAFTSAVSEDNQIVYKTKLYPVLGDALLCAEDLIISSVDQTLRIGVERAPITRVSQMARRFAELSLAARIQSEVDFVILDGNLESTFNGENKFLSRLGENVCALAKTNSLFTSSGNNPLVLLSNLTSEKCWYYFVTDKTYFVKLHPHSKHVFRFDGNPQVLPFLAHNSNDAIFLGYPYGLLLVDKLARVSNEEKSALNATALIYIEKNNPSAGDSNETNSKIKKYLATADAHQILDRVG